MGLTVSSFWGSLSSLVQWRKDEDVRILMLGLDSAGKVRLPQARMEKVMTNCLRLCADNNLV